MDRRRFIHCIGCGCASVLVGCASQRGATKGEAVSENEEAAEPSGHPDWDISVCGLNCAKCKLQEKGDCAGCRGPLDQHWSPNCEFVPCAESKGHRYCSECDELPCDKLLAFASDGHEHHRITVENLKATKEVGLEKWIAQQPRPMFCPGWRF